MNEIEHLAGMAAKGDSSAFEALYQQTCQSVYFTCLSFLKNEQDALDVTQEVYLTALEQMSTLNDRSKFVPWLHRIAVNKCKNVLIKKKPVLMDYEDMENLQTEENDNFLPEEYAINQAKRKIVMDIMEKSLSDTLYQTVIMYYFNGMSVTEIAEISNCPVGTVTYRLSVARAKIKEGVLRYENRNDDKLYAVAGVPLLTSVLVAEMQGLSVPNILPNIMGAATKGTVATQVAEKGANMIFRTLKSKIIAGVVAVAVVGGGIAAAVIISNKKDDGGDNRTTAETTVQNTQEDTESGGEPTEEASQGETTTEGTAETVNTNSRWLLRQDFSTGQLETAPADLLLLNKQLATPISLDAIKQNYDASAHIKGGSGGINGTAEEIFSLDAASSSDDISLYDKGTDFDVSDAHLYLYDVTEQEPTIAEYINNSWWGLSNDGYDTFEFFGYEESDFPDGEMGLMDALVQKLGSPHYLRVGGTKEEFIENANQGNTLDSYRIAWVFDEYVLYIYMMDQFFYDENTVEIENVIYAPRAVWDTLASENKDLWGWDNKNQLDEFFK